MMFSKVASESVFTGSTRFVQSASTDLHFAVWGPRGLQLFRFCDSQIRLLWNDLNRTPISCAFLDNDRFLECEGGRTYVNSLASGTRIAEVGAELVKPRRPTFFDVWASPHENRFFLQSQAPAGMFVLDSNSYKCVCKCDGPSDAVVYNRFLKMFLMRSGDSHEYITIARYEFNTDAIVVDRKVVHGESICAHGFSEGGKNIVAISCNGDNVSMHVNGCVRNESVNVVDLSGVVFGSGRSREELPYPFEIPALFENNVLVFPDTGGASVVNYVTGCASANCISTVGVVCDAQWIPQHSLLFTLEMDGLFTAWSLK